VRTAVVLVGGEASRAGGMEKYFFSYGGKTFIERLTDTLQGVVDEIILVAKDPKQCDRFSHIPSVTCVSDIERGIGPIGGLHAGVLSAQGDCIFVAACDMPCISRPVIEFLFTLMDTYDAVIPAWSPDKLEPLHAVYRRGPLLSLLQQHRPLSMRALVRSLNARYVDINEIRRFDPGLQTFININKIEELERIGSAEDHGK
jgi:molybdenum cofactor guanylyltransferase